MHNLDTRRRPVRLLALAAAVAVLAGVTAACSAGGGTPPAGLSCAWQYKTTKDTQNVAYPDTGATYWSMDLNLIAGDSVILHGTFPDARYMSFTTYSLTGTAIDRVTDRDITPSSGSLNHFADPAAAPGGSYTLDLRSDVSTGTPDNILSTGGAIGAVIYRSYVSGVPGDPTGGSGLPSVSVRRSDGSVVPVANCATPGADPNVLDLINVFGPATDVPAQDPPVFKRPTALGGLFANPDNAYVAAVSAHQAGKVVVIRGKAPTTPDTLAGDSPAEAGNQARYWSMCTDEYRKPYPVNECVFDSQVPLDANGYFTIVASTPADRPATADTAHGVAWLDWGSTNQDMLLIMRHMLADPSFTQSVFTVTPGLPATSTMGAYAPLTARCTVATFDAGGATACGLA